jgi:transcription elongation factor Elf1
VSADSRALISCPECGRRVSVEFSSPRAERESRTLTCGHCGTTYGVESRRAVAYEYRTAALAEPPDAGRGARHG